MCDCVNEDGCVGVAGLIDSMHAFVCLCVCVCVCVCMCVCVCVFVCV